MSGKNKISPLIRFSHTTLFAAYPINKTLRIHRRTNQWSLIIIFSASLTMAGNFPLKPTRRFLQYWLMKKILENTGKAVLIKVKETYRTGIPAIIPYPIQPNGICLFCRSKAGTRQQAPFTFIDLPFLLPAAYFAAFASTRLRKKRPIPFTNSSRGFCIFAEKRCRLVSPAI